MVGRMVQFILPHMLVKVYSIINVNFWEPINYQRFIKQQNRLQMENLTVWAPAVINGLKELQEIWDILLKYAGIVVAFDDTKI